MTLQYETLNDCILCESAQITCFDSTLFLYKCNNCGLIFDNPRPTLNSVKDYYSKKGKYDAWLKIEEGLDAQWKGMLKRILSFKENGELLDIGAGIGHFLHFAKEYFSVNGTEISSEGIEIAREKYGLNLLHGEIENIDFKNRKFDIITMFHVLEHLPYPGRTLQYCKSLLHENGALYISVPNEALYSLRLILPGMLSSFGMNKFKQFASNGFRKIDLNTMEEVHLSHFSEPILTKFLKQNGFHIIKSNIDFLDPYQFKKGPVQILRYIVYGLSYLIRVIFKINCYNCLWIAAKKN